MSLAHKKSKDGIEITEDEKDYVNNNCGLSINSRTMNQKVKDLKLHSKVKGLKGNAKKVRHLF